MDDLKLLVEKYSTNAPRYTSYPTALHFSESANKESLVNLTLSGSDRISLYIHIPFCRTLCGFCGCSTSVCSDESKIDEYLELLEKELLLWKERGFCGRKVSQIHFGGGTPNLLSPKQIGALGNILEKFFYIAPKDELEFSVELDPRTLSKEKVLAFAKIGVNRASIGVQDTNPEVQRAVGRIQPQSKNMETAEWLRNEGIDKINVDLIYGLPLQTPKTFEETLLCVREILPTRIALFGYAHVPWAKPSQEKLERFAFPSKNEKLEIFLSAKNFFEDLGYEYIGLDHFALQNDPLISALKNGGLHRNFQGYTTKAGLDTFAIGLTSISDTKISYRQNAKNFELYAKSVNSGILPIERGLVLNDDDLLRRGIIMDVMCKTKLNFSDYGVDFEKKFAHTMPTLREMQSDGILNINAEHLEITKLGRMFLRNVAMVFDGRISEEKSKYSKTI